MKMCVHGVALPASIRPLFRRASGRRDCSMLERCQAWKELAASSLKPPILCKAIEARASTTTPLAPSYRGLPGQAKRLPPVSILRKTLQNHVQRCPVVLWFLGGSSLMLTIHTDWPILEPALSSRLPTSCAIVRQLGRCHETYSFLVGEWWTSYAREELGTGTKGVRWALVCRDRSPARTLDGVCVVP
jgi:hypothetical protein